MHFSASTVVLAMMATAVTAAIPASQMVNNINAITKLSSETEVVARRISLNNFLITAPQVVNNFRQIVQIAAADVASMASKKRDLPGFTADECLEARDPSQCLDDLQVPSDDFDHVRRQATSAYTEAEQKAICRSFRGFVGVHQRLLATMIGKHGLLSSTPFTRPMGQVLRVIEGGVDTLAFGIINTVPTCAQDATQNKDALDRTLVQAVNTYDN